MKGLSPLLSVKKKQVAKKIIYIATPCRRCSKLVVKDRYCQECEITMRNYGKLH